VLPRKEILVKISVYLAVSIACLCAACTANAQAILFDFEGGPQYTGTPLDQVAGGIRAHFSGQNEDPTHPAYSIQNIAQVIGVTPPGFSGLGLSPDSVFGADLYISFFKQSDGKPVGLTDLSLLTAPQELACDSSSTMRITAYNGTHLVGTHTAIAPTQDTYTWPTINLSFTSAQPFDNVAIHFEAGPPTGGDWGGIFVSDNLRITPVPAPASLAVFGIGTVPLGLAMRRRFASRRENSPDRRTARGTLE
jgi:hypothetical protein